MATQVTDMIGETSDPEIRNAVWALTDGRCAACGVGLLPANGQEASLHVDHIVPKSKGGPDRLSNYQPLCRSCNLRKGDRFANYLNTTPPRCECGELAGDDGLCGGCSEAELARQEAERVRRDEEQRVARERYNARKQEALEQQRERERQDAVFMERNRDRWERHYKATEAMNAARELDRLRNCTPEECGLSERAYRAVVTHLAEKVKKEEL